MNKNKMMWQRNCNKLHLNCLKIIRRETQWDMYHPLITESYSVVYENLSTNPGFKNIIET